MAPPGDAPYARGFATDANTERALRAGLTDREVKIQRGRFKAALQTLVSEPAGRIVFVDLDGAGEPETAARELVSVCPFGTALIAIGSADTADFARSLLRIGFTDYLVKPLSPAAVREASAAAVDELPERTHAGRVIAFAGTAGSGTSTLVATIARAAAGVEGGGRTATVVDLTPLSSTLATRFETEPSGDLAALLATLDPVVAPPLLGYPDEEEEAAFDSGPEVDPEAVDAVSTPAGPGITVIAYPAAGPFPPPPSPAAARSLLEHLANRAHVVMVTGLSDPELRNGVMQQADARVLLYEPTLPSISAAVQCLAHLGGKASVVLVQSHPRTRRSSLSAAQIRYALAERRPDVVIPFDPALHAASTGDGRDRPPGKAWRTSVRQLAERVLEGAASIDI